jgi:N-sulfoglucosamine sulfohydrolase
MAGAGYRTGHIGKYQVGPEQVYRFETYTSPNFRRF